MNFTNPNTRLSTKTLEPLILSSFNIRNHREGRNFFFWWNSLLGLHKNTKYKARDRERKSFLIKNARAVKLFITIVKNKLYFTSAKTIALNNVYRSSIFSQFSKKYVTCFWAQLSIFSALASLILIDSIDTLNKFNWKKSNSDACLSFFYTTIFPKL